jgi:NADH-quinone oxidoreductase subunit N
MLMLPELIVVATGFALLVLDLFLNKRERDVLAPLALFGLAGALVALFATPDHGVLLGGRFAMDPLAWWFKLTFLVAALATVALTAGVLHSAAPEVRKLHSPGEFLAILMFNLAGMLLLSSTRDLITLYVALELATIPLFLLTAWRRDALGGEAGLKYLVTGALASALLLYGLGILYGLTGTMTLDAMPALLHADRTTLFAAALIVAGVGFKLTLVPFHMWAPEVYQGAPPPVTAWLSVASKTAGLAVLMLVLFRVFRPFLHDAGLAIALLATATMTLGNLVAIGQRNILRFMAFSAISQAGYLLLGFLAGGSVGAAAMVFYLLVYAVTNLSVFAVLILHNQQTGSTQITDYRGLSRQNPLLALALMLGLFGLAGIPPLSGFVGKFLLFSVAAQGGYHWLVGVAAVNSTVSLYYYLRIVRQMYIEDPAENAVPLKPGTMLTAALLLTTAASMLLGVVPTVYEAVRGSALVWFQALAQ